MTRANRGDPPRARSRLSRYLFGRGRAEIRARMVVAVVGGISGSIALGVVGEGNLHAPVVEVIRQDGPPLQLEHLASLRLEEIPAGPRFEPVEAGAAGLNPLRVGQAALAVRQEVRRGAFPGAALVAGRGGNVVEKQGFGVLAPGSGLVHPDETLYDLASLTKVIATTTAVMLLVEQGRIELDAPVSRYLPEFTGGAKNRVTVRHLLTHTSGLPAGVGLPSGGPDAVLRRLIATPLKWAPGTRVEYSDIGPVVLWAAAERAAAEPLPDLLNRKIFQPLGMKSVVFRPSEPCGNCAPTTEKIHGHVHDPIAQRLGGVAGNAGLFATAADIGRFAAMLASGGQLEGIRVLREKTIREFTRRQPGADSRALGWDTRSVETATGAGRTRSVDAFGHTGFTGTSLWVDPERGTWSVLLTNRTYTPRAPNRIQALRRTVNDRLAEAADLAD